MVEVLLDFRGKLDVNAIGIGETQEEVVASAMTTRTPEHGLLLAAEVIGPMQDRGAIGDTIADMIDAWLALRENECMMIVIAA